MLVIRKDLMFIDASIPWRWISGGTTRVSPKEFPVGKRKRILGVPLCSKGNITEYCSDLHPLAGSLPVETKYASDLDFLADQ